MLSTEEKQRLDALEHTHDFLRAGSRQMADIHKDHLAIMKSQEVRIRALEAAVERQERRKAS